MIKLFITDLDGCMAHPFITPNWEAVTRIKDLILKSKDDQTVPPMTICSGRPFPYVEAVGQWLGIETPMLFESGAGIYDIKVNKITWNPHFDDEAKNAVEEIKEWLVNTLIKNYDGTYPEFAKYTDAGLVNPDSSKIAMMHEEVLNYMEGKYPMFEVHATDVSVNIILKKANKGHGIKLLCDQLGLDLDEVAYIGDSSGDLPGLTIVGRSYAPVNARSFVKDKVDMITKETTAGVLEAYHDIIKINREKG